MNKWLQANTLRDLVPLLLLNVLVGIGLVALSLFVTFSVFGGPGRAPPQLVERFVEHSASAPAHAFTPKRERAATSDEGLAAQESACEARGGVLVRGVVPYEVVCVPL